MIRLLNSWLLMSPLSLFFLLGKLDSDLCNLGQVSAPMDPHLGLYSVAGDTVFFDFAQLRDLSSLTLA